LFVNRATLVSIIKYLYYKIRKENSERNKVV